MMYIVQFTDGSHISVSENASKAFMQGMVTKDPVFHNGEIFKSNTIQSVRRADQWIEGRKRSAAYSGRYFCRYGGIHNSVVQCSCKHLGISAIMSPSEHRKLLPKMNPKIGKTCSDCHGEMEPDESVCLGCGGQPLVEEPKNVKPMTKLSDLLPNAQ